MHSRIASTCAFPALALALGCLLSTTSAQAQSYDDDQDDQGNYNNPPPRYNYGPPRRYEPARRRTPRTGAPRTSMWIGGRFNYEAPFAKSFENARGEVVSERDLVGPGPATEVDLGIRLKGTFIPFIFFSHHFASNGNGIGSPPPTSITTSTGALPAPNSAEVTSSSSNMFGLGFRYDFKPKVVNPVLEIAYLFRFTKVEYNDGTVLRAEAPGGLRLGAGISIRVSRTFAISPIVFASIANYSDMTVTTPADPKERNVISNSQTHGYYGFQVGFHFDLLGSR
jgi:hypothetical protein